METNNSSRNNFLTFIEKDTNWKEIFSVDRRDSSIYQRIKMNWENSNSNEYHGCINVKTGAIFRDCRRRKIYSKHLTLIIGRPLHTIIKTIWHSLIIPQTVIEIVKTIQGKQSAKEGIIHTAESIADIIRTPLYGFFMTLVVIFGAIAGVFCPNILYHTREYAGKLERDMLRVDYIGVETSSWKLTPCFNPYAYIHSIESDPYWGKSREGHQLTTDQALTKMAKVLIMGRQKGYNNPFDDCFKPFPKDKPYISAAAPSNTNMQLLC